MRWSFLVLGLVGIVVLDAPLTAGKPTKLKQGAAPKCPPGMVGVPAGPFMKGCNPKALPAKQQCGSQEQPYQQATVPAPYCIDKTEVTVEAYKKCLAEGPCARKGCNTSFDGRGQHPINCIEWKDARTYCTWLGKRLPTELEWEKAARGTDGRAYPWGNKPPTCRVVVFDDRRKPARFAPAKAGCGENSTWPVCSRPAGNSPWVVCDMEGNVAEWVEDRDPDPRSYFEFRIVKGSSWGNPAYEMRASRREAVDVKEFPTMRLGFRCASSPLGSSPQSAPASAPAPAPTE
jgi:formylglycine-generating enzyme required for sulfatase activity